MDERGRFAKVSKLDASTEIIFKMKGPRTLFTSVFPCILVITFMVGSALGQPMGDINGDNAVNLADPISALQVVTRPSSPLSVNKAADVDQDGCIGIAEAVYGLQKLAGMRNTAPRALFTASATTGTPPLDIQFNATQSYDPDGHIIGYAWDFGDGSGGDGTMPSHTYTSEGSYSVTLTVTDEHGMRAISSLPIFAATSDQAAFSVTFTHTDDINTWEWPLDWYAEQPGGTVSGPFDSGGTGIVSLGQVSGQTVHLSRSVGGSFIYTYMNVPVQPIIFYTGDAAQDFGYKNVTVNLENATLDDEMLLLVPSWWTIDQKPYTLAQSYAESDMVDNDGFVSVFVSYRSNSNEEPASRYAFRMNLLPSQLGDVPFDVHAMHHRSIARQWQSSVELRNNDAPYLMSWRKGVFILAGESVSQGTSGSFGIPDAFPAEKWYLSSGSIVLPDIVKAFSPLGSEPVSMEPLAGHIDGSTMALNVLQGSFSVSAPGLGSVGYGLLRLANTSKSWEVYFPGDALQKTGDTLTLALPKFPTQSGYPVFTSANLYLSRLDDGATALHMYRFLWNKRGNPMPSYAMKSGYKNSL